MTTSKSKLGVAFLLSLSVLMIFVIIYYFALVHVDVGAYFRYLYTTNAQLVNKNLAQLLNANSIVNLPHVNLATNNADIKQQQECKNSAIYMGALDGAAAKNYQRHCHTTCGSGGRVIEIHDQDEYYAHNKKLGRGAWCVTDTIECNMKTGYVVASLNGVVCRSKFPNMFGGESATQIVACNNEIYPATGSVLYDYRRNEPVDPLTVTMNDEDERLADGSYRFACKFADDINGNAYIENPLNRFHPMRDPCNRTVYRADRRVRAHVNADGWYCECGQFAETRVKNLHPDDLKSTCTSCYNETSDDMEIVYGEHIKVPYNCFTLNSNYNMALNEFPCAGTKFTERGNMCDSTRLDVKPLADGTDDTVRGMLTMPYSNVDFLGLFNKVADVWW